MLYPPSRCQAGNYGPSLRPDGAAGVVVGEGTGYLDAGNHVGPYPDNRVDFEPVVLCPARARSRRFVTDFRCRTGFRYEPKRLLGQTLPSARRSKAVRRHGGAEAALRLLPCPQESGLALGLRYR
jgi:hypothetical protein